MLKSENFYILGDWLNYYISSHNLSSFSIGIICKSNIWKQSYGDYIPELKQKANDNDIYGIASLSKLFTVIEILKLEEKGLLSIEDKVVKHLDYFPNKEITIFDLLLHKAGLERDGKFDFWITTNFPIENELKDYIKTMPISSIGTYKYSNLGYAILGLILSGFNVEIKQENLVKVVGYGKEILNTKKIYDFIDHKSFVPSFGLYKNINEMCSFLADLQNFKLEGFTKRTYEKLLKVYFDLGEDNLTLGFEKWKEHEVYEASGYGFGFVSSILIDVENDFSIVILTNSSEETFGQYFSRNIRRFLLYFSDTSNQFNINSKINGLYRCKDYDVIVYDFADKILIIKPSEPTPFHPDNYEEYKKIDQNKYELVNKPNDPYVSEDLTFNYIEDNIMGFNQGGWGFIKLEKLN